MSSRPSTVAGARIYFVLPAYNEAANIGRVIRDVEWLLAQCRSLGASGHAVFVDDGSTDDTAALLQEHADPARTLLRHDGNRGPGAAFQTAFAHLIRQGLRENDIVMTLEADATSNPELFSKMLARIGENDDLVLASPYLYGGGFTSVQAHRLFISHIANSLVKVFLGIRGVATFSCFYRAYRGSALLGLARVYGADSIVASRGFDCAVELLMKSVVCGFQISEVPFVVDWSKRKGKSKMPLVRTSLAYVRLFFTGRVYRRKAAAFLAAGTAVNAARPELVRKLSR